jgi:hypothetical protein
MAEAPRSYSITELREMALGPKDSDGGQPINLTLSISEVRLIPREVVYGARDLYHQGLILEPINYLNGAFFIFRECVAGDPFLGVPHLLGEDGKYTWPQPTDFPWEDINKVALVGRLIHGNDLKTARIISKRDGTVSDVDVLEGEEPDIKMRRFNEVEEIVYDFENTFKFKVPDLSLVGLVADPVEWQNVMLRNYSNALQETAEAYQGGGFSWYRARDYLDGYIQGLKEVTYKEWVGKYRS